MITLELEGSSSAAAQRLLVAVGREPRVTDLGLETVGVETGGKPIDVDERMRVGGREWLYAIGDVNGRALLTHMGKYQAAGRHREHPRPRDGRAPRRRALPAGH